MDPSEAERLVRSYYELVDAGDTDGLLALFTDDAVYERQGSPDMVGQAALRRFYEGDRQIESGQHDLHEVLPGREWVAVRGVFTGRLKTGEQVEVVFTDWHHLAGDRIDHRQSLFPGRTV